MIKHTLKIPLQSFSIEKFFHEKFDNFEIHSLQTSLFVNKFSKIPNSFRIFGAFGVKSFGSYVSKIAYLDELKPEIFQTTFHRKRCNPNPLPLGLKSRYPYPLSPQADKNAKYLLLKGKFFPGTFGAGKPHMYCNFHFYL